MTKPSVSPLSRAESKFAAERLRGPVAHPLHWAALTMRTNPNTSARSATRRYASTRRGAVLTEYVVVVGVCGIVLSLATASLGPSLADAYSKNRRILMAPVP